MWVTGYMPCTTRFSPSYDPNRLVGILFREFHFWLATFCQGHSSELLYYFSCHILPAVLTGNLVFIHRCGPHHCDGALTQTWWSSMQRVLLTTCTNMTCTMWKSTLMSGSLSTNDFSRGCPFMLSYLLPHIRCLLLTGIADLLCRTFRLHTLCVYFWQAEQTCYAELLDEIR